MLARAVAQSGQIHQPIFWGSGAEIDAAGVAAGGQTKIDACNAMMTRAKYHVGETPARLKIKQQPAQP